MDLIRKEQKESFYRSLNCKATIVENETEVTLVSYCTKVAKYDKQSKKMYLLECPSNTTSRHINEFLYLFSYPKMTKKQILNNINIPL